MSINFLAAANGATAAASSNYSGYLPSFAIDGSIQHSAGWTTPGIWHSATAGASVSTPHILTITMPSPADIGEIEVVSAPNNATSPDPTLKTDISNLYGLKDFTVEYWNGSAWVNFATIVDAKRAITTIKRTNVNTDKIRIVVTNTGDGYARIDEVRGYSAGTLAVLPLHLYFYAHNTNYVIGYAITTPFTHLGARMTGGGTLNYDYASTQGEFVADVTNLTTSPLPNGALFRLASVADGATLVATIGADDGIDPGKTYTVKILQSEPNDSVGIGARLCNHSINGVEVLSNFDWRNFCGGSHIAKEKIFTGIVPNGSGNIVISTSTAGGSANPAIAQSFEIIEEVVNTIAIAPTALDPIIVGDTTEQVLTATGTTGSVTWVKQSGTLPAGVTFDAANHKFVPSSTPTPGVYPDIVIRVTDAVNYKERTYTITVTAPIPNIFENLEATQISSTQNDLVWNVDEEMLSDEDGTFTDDEGFVLDTPDDYVGSQIQRSTDSGFISNVQNFYRADLLTEYSDTTVDNSIQHFYRVRAEISTGVYTDEWSNTVSIGTAPSYTVRLEWKKAVGTPVSYQIRRATNVGFTTGVVDIPVAGGTTEIFDDTALPAGTYYWKIRAKDAAGLWSDYSTVGVLTIP